MGWNVFRETNKVGCLDIFRGNERYVIMAETATEIATCRNEYKGTRHLYTRNCLNGRRAAVFASDLYYGDVKCYPIQQVREDYTNHIKAHGVPTNPSYWFFETYSNTI